MKLFGKQLHIRDKIGFFLTENYFSKKIFKDNRSIIFNRAITRKIIEYFQGLYDFGHQVDLKTGNLGYGFIHYSLIVNLKPKRVLCIGSRTGFIPAILSLAVKENGFGVVDFVDADYDETHPKAWTGIGFWKKVNIKKYFSFLDIKKNLNFYLMTSEEFYKKFKYRYQYIYIDGDHSYEGVKKDYLMFWRRLDKYGLMVFHDVVVKKQKDLPLFGVWRLWQEIKANKIIFPFPKESGLGIVQKL